MEQLLEIRTRPIQFEIRVEPARYEIKNHKSSYELERERGAFEISHQRTKLHMDTLDARASMELKSPVVSAKEFGKRGIQIAYEATAKIAEEGNMMMDSENAIGEIAFQNMQPTLETGLGFLPSVPVNISWEPHNLSLRYQMDKLNFQWRTHHAPEVEYVPGKLEYNIKEYPKIEIKYIGKPIYVPPSADPESERQYFDVVV